MCPHTARLGSAGCSYPLLNHCVAEHNSRVQSAHDRGCVTGEHAAGKSPTTKTSQAACQGDGFDDLARRIETDRQSSTSRKSLCLYSEFVYYIRLCRVMFKSSSSVRSR